MTHLNWHRLNVPPDELGESPFWHPHEHRLYWLDIRSKSLHRASAKGGDRQSWQLPSEPGCVAPARSGGWVMALRDGIYRSTQWGGPLTRLATAVHDPHTARFNDGKADPQGRFWAGTLYEPRDRAAAALYCYAGGTLERMAGEATTGNGLAFCAETRTLYWADTQAHLIRAWDWEPQTNTLSRPRVFHQFALKPPAPQPGQAPYGGRPDGAAVDSQGHYWCAMYEGGRLLRFSPSGQLMQEVPVPLRCPTMPCFGGEDLRTLYLTSARYGRSAQELLDYPWSGQVLWCRVPVPGRPVDFFAD